MISILAVSDHLEPCTDVLYRNDAVENTGSGPKKDSSVPNWASPSTRDARAERESNTRILTTKTMCSATLASAAPPGIPARTHPQNRSLL